MKDPAAAPQCVVQPAPGLHAVAEVRLGAQAPLSGHGAALALANAEAAQRLPAPMLLSWYDRDRNFESPQHVSECHEASAVPGYVDYALSRGATLKVDIGDGRFVFFYLSVEI